MTPHDTQKRETRAGESCRTRIPTDEQIEEARQERRDTRRSRQHVLRALTEQLIEQVEEIILKAATMAGIAEGEELLDYVESAIGNRVLERKLTP